MSGKIEHYVVSTVKQFIPESVRQKWHEYWRSIKSKEVETLGNDNISDGVEMAGWGVEEAQERNKEEASEYFLSSSLQIATLGNLQRLICSAFSFSQAWERSWHLHMPFTRASSF